jgi:1-deoxy-D-xylulose-5-phosphate reductoisomerase
MSQRRNVAVLGSTGSIGRSAIEVIAAFPEALRAVALVAGTQVEAVAEQAARLRPRLVSVAAAADAERLAALLRARGLGPGEVEVVCGEAGAEAAATRGDVEVVLAGIVGAAGLRSTLAAIRAGKTVALANKEALVAAGELCTREAARCGARLLPVDSEHSAIFQALAGQRREDVARLVLTASGGPLRTWPAARIADATPEEALRHPTWRMGPKITIDSATLMNKGLEVIEARWLFDVEPGRIDVLVHPESVVHSMVEFVDGSIVAQLGVSDMRVPIAYALTWPARLPVPGARLDLSAVGALHFEPVDRARFPCVDLAYRALQMGGTAPAALSAANEEVVRAFLAGEMRFGRIAEILAEVLAAHASVPAAPAVAAASLDDVLAADAAARAAARLAVARTRR